VEKKSDFSYPKLSSSAESGSSRPHTSIEIKVPRADDEVVVVVVVAVVAGVVDADGFSDLMIRLLFN
jgi:hypothetical protein